jgi:hypothetical protein
MTDLRNILTKDAAPELPPFNEANKVNWSSCFVKYVSNLHIPVSQPSGESPPSLQIPSIHSNAAELKQPPLVFPITEAPDKSFIAADRLLGLSTAAAPCETVSLDQGRPAPMDDRSFSRCQNILDNSSEALLYLEGSKPRQNHVTPPTHFLQSPRNDIFGRSFFQQNI